MSVATMTSKGRITIPADIRKFLRLKPGDTIDFQVEESGSARISLVPRRAADVCGILADAGHHPLSTEEQDAMMKAKFRQGTI